MNDKKYWTLLISKSLLVFSFCMQPAYSAEYRLLEEEANFAVPVVQSVSSIADRQVGAIVFETSSNQFKGLKSDGNWDPMASVNSTGSAERIERARLVNNGSTCTAARFSGNWVASVTRVSASSGECNINVTSNTFSGPPTCVCVTDSISGGGCKANYDATASLIDVQTFNGSGGVDGTANIICMGPRP